LKKEISLILSPVQASSAATYTPEVVKASGIPAQDITLIRVTRKSIDARGRNIRINMSFDVFAGEEPAPPVENNFEYQNVEHKPEVVVVWAQDLQDCLHRSG
jgi:hypothetical protein